GTGAGAGGTGAGVGAAIGGGRAPRQCIAASARTAMHRMTLSTSRRALRSRDCYGRDPPTPMERSHPSARKAARTTDRRAGTSIAPLTRMKEPLLAIAFVAGCASEIDAIAIEPADSTIEVLNGAIVTPMFHAIAHHDDGTTAPLDGVQWAVSDPRVGAIDDAGVYTPTGSLGGVIEIAAESGDRRGTTSLVVKLHFVDGAGPADPAARDALVHASIGLAEQPASQDP